jgi:hypothetical protein
MKNDVDGVFPNEINLSKIGKYDKFINFTKMPKEYSGNVLFPEPRPFHFTTNDLVKEKLSKHEMFSAMERMQKFLDKKIEDELKQDYKLQEKIRQIEDKIKKAQEKAKIRIDKLKSKPKKKIQEKYGYKRMEEYFEPKLPSEEESSSASSSTESSP